jgi:hypothetical protein
VPAFDLTRRLFEDARGSLAGTTIRITPPA